MSMTRDEAITQLELLLEYCESMMTSEYPVWRRDCEALQMLIAALRPVSREQVEKVFPGCKHCTKQKVPFCYDGASDSVYILTGNGLAAIESDSWGFLVSYCPRCGRPLTDEAVEMVMERLEELHDTSN